MRGFFGLKQRLAATALITFTGCLFLPLMPVQAQNGAPPPPPPPSEGMDPSNAPSTSTVPAPASSPVVKASPAAPATKPSPPLSTPAGEAAPPPPPVEGMDPNSAPATSTGSPAPSAAAPTPTANAVPVASAKAANPAPTASSDDTDEDAVDKVATDNSLKTVFQFDFMRRALWVGLVVSAICAYLGVYVVLRRVVFVGVALSQMSSAGVALSLNFAGMSPMVGSVLTMLAGVTLLSVRWGGRRIRQDAFIGIGYAVAAAAAILLVARSPKGEGDLLNVLFGNILTVSPSEANLTAYALAGVLVFHLLFYKELLFVSFDPDTAAASGYASRIWELLLYITVGLTIAFAIHAVGVLLPFAALVLPSVSALLLTRRMTSALITSVFLGMMPVPIGLYASYVSGLPSGETIVAINFLVLIVVGLYARLRGRVS